MVFLTICALATGSLQGQAKAADKPLGPASRIFVAPVPANAGMTDADIATYLNRHAVPAGLLRTLRPLPDVSKVNEKSSMNAVLVVAAGTKATLTVYMFKPSVRPDLKEGHSVWTTPILGAGAKATTAGLDTVVAKWHKDHGLRTRKE